MHTILPDQAAAIPQMQISPIGVVPKRNRPNTWHLIVDLSSPLGNSVNDGIDQNLSSITYTSIDDAVSFIREAYRAVPVHPLDRPLLGIRWKEGYYLDGALPFGLRSAPKLFSALVDGMMWILHSKGVDSALHYLDDFLILGPPDCQSCQAALDSTLATCESLGFPVAPEKTEGPSTVLTFLGIELDTVRGQLRLPQNKLRDLQACLCNWMYQDGHQAPRRSCELLSLLGLLHHAATVVRPGRAFVHSLINTSTTVTHLDHWVCLNASARADISWWYTFSREWNGISLLPPSMPTVVITSDASGSWGYGATHYNQWLQLAWPVNWVGMPIAPKELAPIMLAVALWGYQWGGTKVVCLCDNMSVVCANNKGSARDPKLTRLMRILSFFSAMYNIILVARYLPRAQNSSAVALSCDNVRLFLALNPQASPVPMVIPSELQELAFNRALIWNSPNWTRLFTTILATASRLPHVQRTVPHSVAIPISASHSTSTPNFP